MAVSMVLAHASALLVAALALIWALAFRTTFLLPSYAAGANATAHPEHLFSVLHPLLMVIGFILLAGEGMLAHRWGKGVGWAQGGRKATHLWLQGAGLGFGVAGAWAKFKGKDGVLANFYSLHSWMGLLCLFLFAAQWMVSFLSFRHRGDGRRARAAGLPWHVFVGVFTYGLAVAAAETGLVEKLTFLHAKHGLPRRSPESALVNLLGLALALLCGIIVFVVIPPFHKECSSSSNISVSSNGHHVMSSDYVLSCYKRDDGVHGSWAALS